MALQPIVVEIIEFGFTDRLDWLSAASMAKNTRENEFFGQTGHNQ